MEIKQYAPVIIPTLNRYDHFRQCLESLEKCTGADKTDVYVALDYPPSEKYVEGWKKNDSYLAEKEKLHRFKSLTVYRRETNYFFSGKGNSTTAIKDATKNCDSYIFSEDDNVFSPNFLEYINKGLEKFKDDKSVFAINGYCHPYPIKTQGNTFFRQNVDFSAWGYGIWKDREDMLSQWSSPVLFREKFSLTVLKKLVQNGYNRANRFLGICYSKSDVVLNDNGCSIYMAVNDMDVIMPTLSLVKNMGWDGSGIHCDSRNLEGVHSSQRISEKSEFEFIGSGYEYYQENKKIFRKSSYAQESLSSFIRSLVKFYIKRLLRY